jgi:methylglutamate dehydrogenase subunit C
MSGYRLPNGGTSINRDRALRFHFDGKSYPGYQGDTLASALLANGVRLTGRSFKYHRPRGIVSAGPEEPSALVELAAGAWRTPNLPATMIELFDTLSATSQNRFPSLRHDLMAVNGLMAPALSAGFYYKSFMWPAKFWERLYEPVIRRAAGLGRLADGAVDEECDHQHHHCDVLVVGSGPAGWSAAAMVASGGQRVMMVEQDSVPGGGYLVEPTIGFNSAQEAAGFVSFANAKLLTRTAVIGAYHGGVFAAVERHAPGSPARETLHIIRARQTILATGAVERLIAFPDNDRPGVMLASAARAYLNRWGVAVGRRVALFTNNDEAYQTAQELRAAGVEIAAIIDPRPESWAAAAAIKAGIRVLLDDEVYGVGYSRSRGLHAVHTRRRGDQGGVPVACDTLLVSGGYSPQVQLATQAGAKLAWDESIAGFVAGATGTVRTAGAARGVFGSAEAAADGEVAGRAVVAALSEQVAAPHPRSKPAFAGLTYTLSPQAGGERESEADLFSLSPSSALRRGEGVGLSGVQPDETEGEGQPQERRHAQHTPLLPFWEVRVGRGAKSFVDLQHDVTAADMRLAHQEGYSHVEHAKRYTTHGMGTDQGKIGGLVGSAVLAAARGAALAEVGLSKPRPYTQPVSWGALAGPDVGQHFKPQRLLPLHDWHTRNHAVFVKIGLWMRPLVYSATGDTGWGPVLAEARGVRRSVGVTDMSSLGKIDVQGPDAGTFLDRIYANTFSTLPVGRARYGIMLREDGMMLDDGTTARLGEQHFLVTATTQKAADVLEHMEWHAATVWPELDVTLTNVADHWAQFAMAGPNARKVVERVVMGRDMSNEAFPFMAAGEATIAGVAGRLFRISFSGEAAYEVAVPAQHAEAVWTAILAAGNEFGIVPYALDALNVMRIEKGHVTGGEINGQTTAMDLGFGKMLKKKGDFVGKALSQRDGLLDPKRLQLVGIAPVDTTKRLRGGGHLVGLTGAGPSLGYVTAACMASEGEGWIGLALLSGGQARHGERLVAASPVFDEAVEVVISSPHRLDPENARVKA